MTLWAITSYFNPRKFQRRYYNYLTFRNCLNLPLLTIEWDFNNNFDLTSQDADILLQVSGGDLMWQKERLLNIAINHLPSECDMIVWLDCDIVFMDDDWIDQFKFKLKNNKIIQLFNQVIHLNHLTLRTYNLGELLRINNREKPLLVRESIISYYHNQKYLQQTNLTSNKAELTLVNQEEQEILRLGKRPSSGHGWGATRQLIQETLLYDACIAGVGDMAIALAVLNLPELFLQEYPLNNFQKQHYQNWAEIFIKKIKGKVCYLNCDILHLFHGKLINRQYQTRLQTLAELNFDPNQDLMLNKDDVWQWNHNKQSLQKFMIQFFTKRAEDS